jgi:hypothetical protein
MRGEAKKVRKISKERRRKFTSWFVYSHKRKMEE